MTAPNVTQEKGQHPADGSPRWTVIGTAGRVVYDILGNHLALIPTYGEIDSVMGKTLARVREYALLNEDGVVFGILADLYRTELERHPRIVIAGNPCCGGNGVEASCAVCAVAR